MNGYLLDTHTLLRWLTEPSKLSQQARDTIAEPSNPVFVSVAAIWEMVIKRAAGRLDMPDELPQVLAADNILPLPITLPHVLALGSFPSHHQDPFDRIMIAQARVESLVLITRDRSMERYDVNTLRA